MNQPNEIMTREQILSYIETEWPEINDPEHCVDFVVRNQHTDPIDKILGYYVRMA